MIPKYSLMSVLFFLVACATIPDYYPIVDPASITDSAEFSIVMDECRTLTNNVDYSDEEGMAALKGAAVGGAAVVAGTSAVLAATGTVLLAPIVWPLLGAGVLIGATANSRKTNAEEQGLRALVWNRCLIERGYVVLSEGYVSD